MRWSPSTRPSCWRRRRASMTAGSVGKDVDRRGAARLRGDLRDAGLDSPELDARDPRRSRARADHAALAAAADARARRRGADGLRALAARRLAGEPVARIIGAQGILGPAASRHAATLVPRPETETVVEAALAASSAGARRARCASPISAPARARSCWRCCRAAGRVAASAPTSARRARGRARNAAALGLASRAGFVRGDFGTALAWPIRSRRV